MEKIEISRCNRLIDDGFSLITVKADKVPNIAWKEYQTHPMKKDTFQNFYNLTNTQGVGIVTGYDDLEVIDVDLKVLQTPQERESFWNEYYSMLCDNIQDFKERFVIVKTRNYGYHILYKCDKKAGNIKIAKLKGVQEAIIESRGIGGYVWIYDQFLQGNGYNKIQRITEADREILWTISKMYNHVEQIEQIKPTKIEKEYHETEIKTWDDYNEKTRIFDLISSEFTIVRKLANKLVIKRNGAKSPHSGYIFDNSKSMFLFSTGTQYPNEKLLTSFHIYAIQKHNGDFSLAAKDLYKQGYGSRVLTKQTKRNIQKEEENKVAITADFPLEIYPQFIQRYINDVANTLNSNLDFLGSAFLWIISLSVGNAIKLEVKTGWIESGILWIALVGRAGVGKTHTIKSVTDPLEIMSGREVRKYTDQLQKYEAYMALDKKEKALAEEIKKPKKTKFIVDDITIEALTEVHDANQNGIGILRDEMVGWIKDMNKYREGSDQQKYLSCWSNGILSSDRKTSGSNYVEKAYIPILGGIQPSVLSGVYTEETKENGFMDRILICYPEIKLQKYNKNQMSEKLLNEYSEFITFFYDSIKTNVLKYDNFGSITPNVFNFDAEAENEWARIYNEIQELMDSDNENEYIKSVLPKLQTYVARFSLLLEVLYSYSNNIPLSFITAKSVLNAEKLYKYFFSMAKKNKFQSMENKTIIEAIKFSGKRNSFEQFTAVYEENKNLNKTRIANS